MNNIIKNLWFDDPKAPITYINETAVRMRAGLLFIIPVFMSFTLYDAWFVGKYAIDVNTLTDTYETNWDDQIIYSAEVVRRVKDYSLQTYLLIFALFEMLAGLFVFTSRFSITIYISTFLARNSRVVLKPLAPKRFAWTLGGSMIAVCLIFFNPDTFAGFVNDIYGSVLLPTTYNYIPYQIPTTLVWVCVAFMWLEVVFGYCVGCKLHALMVWLKIIDDECVDCNDITKRN